jgi:hypothetical protein
MSSPRINKYVVLFNLLILFGTIWIAKIYVDHSIDKELNSMYSDFSNELDNLHTTIIDKLDQKSDKNELSILHNNIDKNLHYLSDEIKGLLSNTCDGTCKINDSIVYKMNCTMTIKSNSFNCEYCK